MKKTTKLLIVIITIILSSLVTKAQSNTQIRYAQLIIESPENVTSVTQLDITLLSIENIHSIKIQYGSDSDIDQYYNQTYTLNSTTNLTNNIITDEGIHAVVNIGTHPVLGENILTISLLDVSGNIIENKQIK